MIEPTKEQIERTENNFTYHPPKPDQVERYNTIRQKGKEFAIFLQSTCPNSRELSLAITNLEESIMWANAAIARNE